MTSDLDLRDLLQTEAGGPTSAPTGWDDVVRRGRHRQRVRRARTTALGSLAVVAAVAGLVLADQDQDVETVPPATAPTVSDPTTSVPDRTSTSIADGPASAIDHLSAARVDGALVTLIQAPSDPPSGFDPCTVWHPRVSEAATEVIVEVVDASLSSGQPWLECQAGPFSGWGTLELAAPLGDRRLINARDGAEIPVLQDTDLLYPTYLPDVFDPSKRDEFAFEGSWTFGFSGDGGKLVNITTGYAGTDPVCEVQTVDVRGTQGQLCGGELGRFVLQWEEAGTVIHIEVGDSDPEEDAGFTLDNVLAIAEGLEPLGG